MEAVAEKIIGVLGGMGPESSADLLVRITRATPARVEQDHLRVILDSNPKIPNRTDALLSGELEPVIAALVVLLVLGALVVLVLPDRVSVPERPAPATAALLRRRGRVDLAVLLPNSFRTALVARLGGARRVVGYSRDGFHWDRPMREAFIPVSETYGDWNWGNVQSAGGGCLVVDDKLYFYVSGREPREPKGRCTTGLAVLRRDGFASMDADE